MKIQISFSIAVIICLILGISFKQDPYSIREIGRAGDQLPLKHKDSPYSHISWIISESSNYAQLRFMDRVEGGVCLKPSWDEYEELAKNNPTLKHLISDQPWPARGKPGKQWPAGKAHPNPGTLTNVKYVGLFPTGVLLNRSLMEAANNDPRQAKPNIIIVGLGSGIGISLLAHHFPEASITVVDIDQVVIDVVYDHYPFMEWLSKQTCSDGRHRLKVVAGDARQFMHYPKMRDDNGLKYDLAILDAYTSGSTIPSHLMTKEFFERIKDLLTPDGILLSNIIGSYTGPKKFVVGGAMRSQQAAGFTYVHNFPIVENPMRTTELLEVNDEFARNNIMVASAQALSPQKHKKGWELLEQFTPYPDLPIGKSISEQIVVIDLSDNSKWLSTSVSLPPISNNSLRKIRSKAKKIKDDHLKGKKTFAKNDDYSVCFIDDVALVDECINGVREQWGKHLPTGWDKDYKKPGIRYDRYDWVLYARRTFERSVKAAQSRTSAGYQHDADFVVGQADGTGRAASTIPDAPLYTDAQPNADIYNR